MGMVEHAVEAFWQLFPDVPDELRHEIEQIASPPLSGCREPRRLLSDGRRQVDSPRFSQFA